MIFLKNFYCRFKSLHILYTLQVYIETEDSPVSDISCLLCYPTAEGGDM